MIHLQLGFNKEPELYNVLNAIPDHYLYDHRQRHPLAIYNMSTGNIFKAFKNVIDSFELYSQSLRVQEFSQRNPRSVDPTNLLNNYRELLYAFQSFIDDDCYHILKALYPPNPNNKERFVKKWMEKEDARIKPFMQKFTQFRKEIADKVNKMKHNHAELRIHAIKIRTELIIGYFIEGIDENKSMGPDIDIHPKFRGWDTALSFHRDLKYLMVNFLFILQSTSDLLKDIITSKQIQLSYKNDGDAMNDTTIIKKIGELSDGLFFADEYWKIVPKIIINKRHQLFTFNLPGTIRSTKLMPTVPMNYESISQHVCDGVTSFTRSPYSPVIGNLGDVRGTT